MANEYVPLERRRSQVFDTMSNPEVEENASVGDPDVDRDADVTEDLDVVFESFRAARRRYLLYVLEEAEEAMLPVEDAVAAVRTYEAAGTGKLPSRQPIRMSLVHHHLPYLESVGVLDYDPREGAVRYHGHPSFDGWLERARTLELESRESVEK